MKIFLTLSLVIVFLTGCGSNATSDNKKEEKNSHIVTVSDGHILDANCTINNIQGIDIGDGQYEWAESDALTDGIVQCFGGFNDLNGNDIIDDEDKVAPDMAAPDGFDNVNPFTTMMVNGVKEDVLKNLTNISNFDVDVVAEASTDPDLAKESAVYAALIYEIQNSLSNDNNDENDSFDTLIEQLNSGYQPEQAMPELSTYIEEIRGITNDVIAESGMGAFQDILSATIDDSLSGVLDDINISSLLEGGFNASYLNHK